ncbi:DNA-directed RNA polymerase subunit beta [Nocardia gipuzkoensis]|uniref:DNA-directed RNA polymerase subunit beta n=1 Tax=Nocardia gipuzkoensis TaxID=2749991 RepID=UPI003EE36FF2
MHAPADVIHRSHYYRHACGLPCYVDREAHRIVLRAGIPVGAVTMPEHWGESVRDRLAHQGLRGPIVWHRSRRWTFLTRAEPPELAGDHVIAARLMRLSASIVPAGGEIALPGPADELAGYRRWVVAPRDPYRPNMTTVVETLLDCSAKAVRR